MLKTWCRNFALPAGIHYDHCVSPSVQFAFRTFLLAPNTDLSTFTMSAHYSQLINAVCQTKVIPHNF